MHIFIPRCRWSIWSRTMPPPASLCASSPTWTQAPPSSWWASPRTTSSLQGWLQGAAFMSTGSPTVGRGWSWSTGRGVWYAKSLWINIFKNVLIDIDIFKNILINNNIFTTCRIDINIFQIILIDIDIVKKFLSIFSSISFHRTAVDEVPYAICPFQNKVLIGVGRLLRLYDLGRKKLLRKCENKHIPHLVVDIKVNFECRM